MNSASEFARIADVVIDADSGAVLHAGSPFADQRALAAGALVPLVDRGVIVVTGPDRLSWLNSISSQLLLGLAPGDSAETLLLSIEGRIEQSLRVIDDGESTWLIVDGAVREQVFTWLDRMRFTLRVEVTDRTDDFVVVGWQHASAGWPRDWVATSHDVALNWNDPWNDVVAGGFQYAANDHHPAHEYRWTESLVPVQSLASLVDAISAGELSIAGTLAAEALRIAAWRPSLAHDVDERTLPHELDWMRSAVHLNKGCYKGQESVAKVHNLGHPPRRLVFLHLDGSAGSLPEPGSDVVLNDDASQSVGHITSVARHAELGPIALAVVRRAVNPEATLAIDVDGELVSASQEVIVPRDAGAVIERPRLPRLGVRTR